MYKKSLFILKPNLSSLPMQLIIKKLLIICILIIAFDVNQSKLIASNKYDFNDFGVISIMYHRFNEKKYPSTNIQLDVFKEQIKIIENSEINFIHPKNFQNSLSNDKDNRKILLTIDDGLLSFYKNAWPILKEKNPFYFICKHTRSWCL